MKPTVMSPRVADPGDVSRDAAWARLQATAAVLRAGAAQSAVTRTRRPGRVAVTGCVLGAAACAGLAGGGGREVAASSAANADLFALTNQDRSSNGVGSLQGSATLAGIGEGTPYHGCGFTVYGRSQDMISRNYFAHPILGCGQLVFAMMQANNVHYVSAGENIGWDSGPTDPGAAAQFINTEFMNSPEHRSNILNRSYTHLGVGTAQSNSWSGVGGGPYGNVWMFSEEFAQLGGSPPPASPVHAATGPTAVLAPVRNDPAPPPPAQPPLVASPAAAPPVATPVAAPAPRTVPVLDVAPTDALAPPPTQGGGGYLADSVEAVLEAYLVD
ncbi:MAG: CAP domain-containing protein [Candidatus Dormibacteria bacterium]